jgi:hypothetical protein
LNNKKLNEDFLVDLKLIKDILLKQLVNNNENSQNKISSTSSFITTSTMRNNIDDFLLSQQLITNSTLTNLKVIHLLIRTYLFFSFNLCINFCS